MREFCAYIGWDPRMLSGMMCTCFFLCVPLTLLAPSLRISWPPQLALGTAAHCAHLFGDAIDTMWGASCPWQASVLETLARDDNLEAQMDPEETAAEGPTT
jgi:hypothetical protein